MIKQRNLIFVVLTLALLCIDTLFVVVNHRALDAELRQQVALESDKLQSAFSTILDQTYSTLLTIATFVANDPQVQVLFRDGVSAVEAEGGGAGGEEAAHIRNTLFDLLAENWGEVQTQFGARQLHFHLGPGSTSFLRVHRPERFGDNMDEVRFTIVDTHAEQTPRSGFETGRVYSGLRGVVPVFAPDADSEGEMFVGALESGTSFDNVLSILADNYGVNAAVLLTEEHVEANMWPEAIDRVFARQVEECRCYIEASTSPDIESVVEAMVAAGMMDTEENHDMLKTDNGEFVISSVAIRDYRASRDPTLAHVGRVVFWEDAAPFVASTNKAKRFNFLFAIFAFIFIEILFYFGLKAGLRRLEREVEDRVDEVSRGRSRFERAESIAGLAVWDWEASGSRVLLSDNGMRMLSIDTENGETTLNAILDRVHPDDRQSVESAIRQAAITGGRVGLDHRVISAEGRESVVQHLAEAETDHKGRTRVCSTLLDVTDRHRLAQTLRREATHDSLTGVLNRAGFRTIAERTLERSIRDWSACSLLMLDADNFKLINDNFGHHVGDRVLIEITRSIASRLRPHDTLGRLGGEEFALLLPGTSAEEAEQVGERLLDGIRSSSVTLEEGGMVKFTISAGLASCQGEECTLDCLLGQADQALYVAKSNGRDRLERYG